MYCKMCGKVNVATARFCCECGSKLPESENREVSADRTNPASNASATLTGNTAPAATPAYRSGPAPATPAYQSGPAPAAAATTPAYQSGPAPATPTTTPAYQPGPAPAAAAATPAYRSNPAPGTAPAYTQNPTYRPNPGYPGQPSGAVPNRQVLMRNQDDDYIVRRVRVDRTPSVGGIIISVLLIIACFIPYLKVQALFYYENMSFSETGWGAIVASGTIVAIVFSCLHVKWGLIGPGIGSLLCYLAQIITFFATSSSILSGYGIKISNYVHLQIGFFAVPILSIMLILCGAMFSDNYTYQRVRRGASDDLISKLNDHGSASNCWICCRCGTQNAMYVGTCKCGTVKTDPKNIMINEKPNKNYYSSSIAKCPSCGRLASGNQTICYECGARLIR